MSDLKVTIATEQDVPSLSTIVARAYHPTNEYFRTTFPDTPLMREWWSSIWLDAIQDPAYELLTVLDDKKEHDAVGLLVLNRATTATAAAVYKRHPPTADHDQDRWTAMISGDHPPEYVKLAGDGVYLGIELLGVDEKMHGSGLGKKLLLKACEVADKEGLDIIVSSNLMARSFYEKCGFKTEFEVVLPGPDKYCQAFLTYKAKRAR